MSNKPRYQQKTVNNSTSEGVESQRTIQYPGQRRKYISNQDNNSNKNYQNRKKYKYQSKNNHIIHKSKYGFQYDQNKINNNTQIPQLPQKLRYKPDETKNNQKIQEIQNKVMQLKKLRKTKKQTYKNGNQHFKKRIQQQQYKIKLAKASLIILNLDQKQLQTQIQQVQSKLQYHKKKIDQLNKPTMNSNNKKKIQQMDYQQLVRQQGKVLNMMSTQQLKKAQQVQLNNKLNKITKRKIQLPKQNQNYYNKDSQKYQQIQQHKQSIDRLRKARQIMSDRLTDIIQKMQSITDNMIDFQQIIQQTHQKQRVTDNSILLQQAALLKQKIYALWDQIAQIKSNYFNKLQQYQQQQQKIKYIKWAEEVKNNKKIKWEQEKQQRKKIKNKQKQQKKYQDKDKKQTNTIQTQQKKPQYQRKKINKNQKQIDTCSFIIQYCKNLNSSYNQNNQQNNTQKQFNLQQALKKGQWAKMKNLQVIQGKKKKAEQQIQPKHYKKKQIKSQIVQTTNRFSHTYFVAQIFDSVKVLPPSKPEELQKTIAEVEDKLEYFLAHPDEQSGKSQHLIQGKDQKQKQGKGFRKINTEQFPALR